MSKFLFARLQADVDVKLRRGAWYKVLQLRGLDVVIEVNRKPFTVLRAWVELSHRPPQRWSVVKRSKRYLRELGQEYGVCPHCRTRAPLPAKAREQPCPRCKGVFEVAWGEGYLT